MAFTRKIYDENAYKQELYEVTKPNRYQLLEPSTHRGVGDTCFQATPEIHTGAGNHSQYRIGDNNMVNVESDLFNLIRKDSNDPKAQYPFIKKQYTQKMVGDCTKTDLARSYPLLEGSQFKREQQIAVPRFESLCLNPQEMSRIRSNHYIGLNTRLLNRDNTRKVDLPKVNSKPASNFTHMAPIDQDIQKFASLKVSSKLLDQYNKMHSTKSKDMPKGKKEGFANCTSCGL
jgi:hypothetical protein